VGLGAGLDTEARGKIFYFGYETKPVNTLFGQNYFFCYSGWYIYSYHWTLKIYYPSSLLSCCAQLSVNSYFKRRTNQTIG
jgi:hypothetical protein